MSKSIFDTIENGDTVTAEIVAENAWGAALDNGNDMANANAEQHAKEEYDGYVEHTLIVCDELIEGGLSDETWSKLEQESIKIISEKKNI